ncbi:MULTISPECIES: proline--tRNA ligase [unclassified Nitratiruptor]|uniref:proline--tRNA ligase n=1 Tax=unclassified Nitratiruptor TaxID=2624044 RepID=UPI001916C224|nr:MULTISPECIES: proline--tRNA ligase [unclassified Nitratiruptor]BCD60261.1 prolyl-tRNA synthetase [Nitratiruptor sp. YY08-10]BCD64250.1 prolyl-tRNA synthetase [Nitratiruptor sp. YY08-14]
MRFSKTFIPTMKENPKDAVLPSHIYLVRGGFITQVASGIYNFLPLGKKVLDKIRAIVKEELDKAGCQEVSLGFVTPCELWEESGRFGKYGKELLRFKDRKENCFVLGPTHEEMMVDLVRNRVTSYKQLPLNLYQINWKFRDEARPRFGLLRGREFLMKDGYSFHADEEDMKREYSLMEQTYRNIFTRLGLRFRAVEADVGAIGGSASKEFMVIAESGEDTIAICSECEYAANVEAAKRKKPEAPAEAPEFSNFEPFYTPNLTSIEELSDFFKVHPYYFVKAVAKKALYDEGEEIVLFFLRGSDELQEVKAANAIGANELVDVNEEELEKAGIVPGFIAPYEQQCTIVFDEDLKGAKGLICGGNKKDYHLIGADLSHFDDALFVDIAQVKEGDLCPKCGAVMKLTKGIEVGHIFQLGTRYSVAMNATFLDKEGKAKPFVMGTYGIGVSRLVAAAIEQNHDDKGCIWPLQIAPFEVDIIVSNIKDEEQYNFAQELYEKLKNSGVDVILDDRPERFGPKIKDFELIGFPYGIIVGKGLKEGKVQIVERATLEKVEIPKEEIFEMIMKKVQAS